MRSAERSGFRRRSAPLRWAETVARQFGGRAVPGPARIRLDVEGPEWRERGLPPAVEIAEPPDSPEQWTLRLRILEQMAARALASPPYFFSVRIEEPNGRAHGAQEVDVLRVALGLAQVSGRLALARWTAYHLDPFGLTAMVPAEDSLFAERGPGAWQECPAPEPSVLQSRLERLAGAVASHALSRPERHAASREALAREARELEALYFRTDEGLPALRGLAPEGESLDHAAEAEHRSRLGDLVERYSFVRQLHVLSVGWIRCHGTAKLTAGEREVSLPFVTLRGEDLLSPS